MEVETRTSDEIAVSEQAVSDFLAFLNGKDEYLDTGLGAFLTDNHSNW